MREGGSLPAIAEADDGFLYVLKFRGGRSGCKSIDRRTDWGRDRKSTGTEVPEIVFANLDTAFGRSEPDEEIQDLLKASVGLNLALHYLSGAVTFDAAVTTIPDTLASKIVWLDCLLTNVDRTARNTNMLVWHKELWLIDHGCCFVFPSFLAELAGTGHTSFCAGKRPCVTKTPPSELDQADKNSERNTYTRKDPEHCSFDT